jgi:hypothetical protein
MRGIIQFISARQLNADLDAAGGNRYSFTLFDCMSGRQPRAGDLVEFNAEDGVAVELNCSPTVAPADFGLNERGRPMMTAAGHMVRSVGNRISNNTPLQPRATSHGSSEVSQCALAAPE